MLTSLHHNMYQECMCTVVWFSFEVETRSTDPKNIILCMPKSLHYVKDRLSLKTHCICRYEPKQNVVTEQLIISYMFRIMLELSPVSTIKRSQLFSYYFA